MIIGKPTSLAKLTIKLRSPREVVAGSTGAGPANSAVNSWLTRGRDQIAAQAETARIQANKKFAPEFYMRDGETKQIRHRFSEPLGSFMQYSFKLNGKWERVTAPPPGETDKMHEAGLKAQLRFIYEVIDVAGYTDKQGKVHKMVPRFYVANHKQHTQFEAIKKMYKSLTANTIEISRVGKGPKTAYTFLPLPASILPGLDKIPFLKGDIEKYYAPPGELEQHQLMSRFNPAEQDND